MRELSAMGAAPLQAPRPIDSGPFAFHPLDVANLSSGDGLPYQLPGGYGLQYLQHGSAPDVRLLVDIGGTVVRTMSPGDVLRGRFERARVGLAPNSAAVGAANLLVLATPDARYDEQPGSVRGLRQLTSYAATANATNNASGLAATAGANLAGVTGWRAVVSAADGQTLSGAGSLRLWYYSLSLARWVRSQDLLWTVSDTGQRDFLVPDQLVTVPAAGRMFIDPVSVTVSSGALTCTIETWGDGQ